MSEIHINQVLQQMRALAAVAHSRPIETVNREGGAIDFAQILKESVSALSQTSGSTLTPNEPGAVEERGTELADGMAAQRISVSLETLQEVRNKLLDAYREIMNMPV